MNSISPKVIFIDGPTGVGKGYLINDIKEKYTAKYPNNTTRVIEAKKIVFNEKTITEDRKYTHYLTEEELLDEIFKGHLRLLQYLKSELLNNSSNLILVDRSYFSFLCYNIAPLLKRHNRFFIKEKLENYNTNFIGTFNSLFTNIPILFINVGIQSDFLNTVKQRLIDRKDSKDINLNWLHEVNSYYSNLDREILELFYSNEVVDSNAGNYLISKYF